VDAEVPPVWDAPEEARSGEHGGLSVRVGVAGVTLTLIRRWFSPRSTIGELLIDDVRQCFTLEDFARQGPKVFGQTAIPAGRYQVAITESARFKRPLPLLLDVPGFEGVRIHPGNCAEDTAGCILVGSTTGPDRVNNSRKAFAPLFARLQQVLANGGPVWLTILERPSPAPSPSPSPARGEGKNGGRA
jgi:hypothetical protein